MEYLHLDSAEVKAQGFQFRVEGHLPENEGNLLPPHRSVYHRRFQYEGCEHREAEHAEAQSVPRKTWRSLTPCALTWPLNFSAFMHDVTWKPDDACKMACTAFKGAIAVSDKVQDDSYDVWGPTSPLVGA